MVFGSVALDIGCDFVSTTGSKDISPQMHTSNLGKIKPSIGGVGYNVTLAAQSVTSSAAASLYTFVADDMFVPFNNLIVITNFSPARDKLFITIWPVGMQRKLS